MSRDVSSVSSSSQFELMAILSADAYSAAQNSCKGASTSDVVFAHFYPLSGGIAGQVPAARSEFFDPAHTPAGALLLFEGLPSMDAGFAVDVAAVK